MSVKLFFNGRATRELDFSLPSSDLRDRVRDVRDLYAGRIDDVNLDVEAARLRMAKHFGATKHDDATNAEVVDEELIAAVPRSRTPKELRDVERTLTRTLETIGDEFVCALIRCILDREKLGDPELLAAIDSPPDSPFWRSQNNVVLEAGAATFRESNSL